MIRVLVGGIAGAVAMFVMNLIFWASPLAMIGLSSVGDQPGAVVQQALAANLPHTGHYIVPDPQTPGGSVLYGKGPVAQIDYNAAGFARYASPTMIGGFVQEIVVALMIGFSLYAVAGRVTDFPSRARLVVGLTAATMVLVELGDPIWMHGDWRYAIYALIANLAAIVAGGLVVARWFVPVGRAS